MGCSRETVCMIDEKHGGRDIGLLSKLSQKLLGQLCCSRRKQAYMEEFIRLRIDSSNQLVLLAIVPDHYLVEDDVTRIRVASRL